jgi:hypothetical protein
MRTDSMKRTPYILLIIFVVFSSLGFAQSAKKLRRISPVEIESIKRAVQDEIYDYGYYKDFYHIGENTGTPEHWMSRTHIYIKPTFDATNGYGIVIYKLMPFGQVYRLFYLDEKGVVKLDGDPQNGFPLTQPSRQTVFMDEEDICHDETTWISSSFIVDVTPSVELISSSARRQQVRTGFSFWEDKHPASEQPKK